MRGRDKRYDTLMVMTNPPLAPQATVPSHELAAPGPPPVSDDVRYYVDAARAPETRRCYAVNWRRFESFAKASGAAPMPASPELVVEHLSALGRAGLSMSTISQAHATIAAAHKACGAESPTASRLVQLVMSGLSRKVGCERKKKRALTAEQMVAALGVRWWCEAATLRNRAILSLGFLGCFRRSEIVALDVEDVQPDGRDLRVRMRRSKTDQAGKGITKGIPRLADGHPLCAVQAIEAWMAHARPTRALFLAVSRIGRVRASRLHAQDVARAVKYAMRAIGENPALYSGHSLRSGHLTCGHRSGASLPDLMRQAGHKSANTTLGYIQEADLNSSRNSARAIFASLAATHAPIDK